MQNTLEKQVIEISSMMVEYGFSRGKTYTELSKIEDILYNDELTNKEELLNIQAHNIESILVSISVDKDEAFWLTSNLLNLALENLEEEIESKVA